MNKPREADVHQTTPASVEFSLAGSSDEERLAEFGQVAKQLKNKKGGL